MIVFKAGDLISRCLELLKKVDRALIKWRAEAEHAVLAGSLHDRPMPLPGGVGLGIEIVQVLAGPEAALIADLEIATAHIEGDRVGGVGLQLEGMGTGLGRCIHDGQGTLQALIVITAHLGDHQRWLIRADQTIADPKSC